jgi:hypothetical protein
MKTCVVRILKSRFTRWGFTAALLMAVATSVGRTHQRHYRLGGGWVGGHAGLTYNALQIPLDPDGQTEAIRVSAVAYDADFEALLAALGANAASESVGEGRMISRDTCKWTIVSYAQVAGTTLETTAILVYSGTWTFTGPDTAVLHYTLKIYPVSADANGDGLPDAGATPVMTIPGFVDTATRVPIQ